MDPVSAIIPPAAALPACDDKLAWLLPLASDGMTVDILPASRCLSFLFLGGRGNRTAWRLTPVSRVPTLPRGPLT